MVWQACLPLAHIQALSNIADHAGRGLSSYQLLFEHETEWRDCVHCVETGAYKASDVL